MADRINKEIGPLPAAEPEAHFINSIAKGADFDGRPAPCWA